MKIRTGFVSNSSSTSFCVPSFLLTDEQKEMLLSIDDQKETKAKMKEVLGGDYDWENSKNDYPVDEEYHRIYEKMIEDNEWDDSGWEISESKEFSTISGATGMWNGTIEKFMEKIGIDPTMIEIINHGHFMVHMATHPEAVKHQIWLHEQQIKRWEALDEKDKEFEIDFGHKPMAKTPYAMDDSKFKSLGNTSLQYEEEGEEEMYSFVKDKKNED